MDKIYKLLCFDICELLTELFQTHFPDSESGGVNQSATTSNGRNYPSRLVTYDAEEIGEPRLIRFSDLTESTMHLLLTTIEEEDRQLDKLNRMREASDCGDDTLDDLCSGQQQGKGRKRQLKQACSYVPAKKLKSEPIKFNADRVGCKTLEKSQGSAFQNPEWTERIKWAQLNAMLTSAFDALCPGEQLSAKRLVDLESRAKNLHKQFVKTRIAIGRPLPALLTEWQRLLPMHKFRYYWEALTRNVLQPTPFLNFQLVFARRYNCDYDVKLTRRNMKVLRLWRSLKCREQLPFILNALLYQISVGVIDPYCPESVRYLINMWSRQPIPSNTTGGRQPIRSGK